MSIIYLLSFCMASEKPGTTFPRTIFPVRFWVRSCPGEMLLRNLERGVIVTTKVGSPVTLQWLPSESQGPPALELQAQVLVWIHCSCQPCSLLWQPPCCAKLPQSRLILGDPMDCSLPGSCVHGNLDSPSSCIKLFIPGIPRQSFSWLKPGNIFECKNYFIIQSPLIKFKAGSLVSKSVQKIKANKILSINRRCKE